MCTYRAHTLGDKYTLVEATSKHIWHYNSHSVRTMTNSVLDLTNVDWQFSIIELFMSPWCLVSAVEKTKTIFIVFQCVGQVKFEKFLSF